MFQIIAIPRIIKVFHCRRLWKEFMEFSEHFLRENLLKLFLQITLPTQEAFAK